MQYGWFARSFHGATSRSSSDKAASCWRAVQAQGFSEKAERSAHAAETRAVPRGQTLPSAHCVSM